MRAAIDDNFTNFFASGVPVPLDSIFLMDEAERCQRIGFMYDGKLIALGNTVDLKRQSMEGELLEISLAPQNRGVALMNRKRQKSVLQIWRYLA